MIVLAVAAVVLAVFVAGLYVDALRRKNRAEQKAELVLLRQEVSREYEREHDAWLRGLVDRALGGSETELERKQAVIDKLLSGPEPVASAEQVGLEDQRLDIPADLTADWTDFDPMLWGNESGTLGAPPPGFPVPSAEEFFDG